MNIGILAVQGAFAEHENCLRQLGVNYKEIRKKEDLRSASFDGLILPGGESTVMGKLTKELGIFDEMQAMVQGGMPVFGTCAGLLLLAKEIENDNRQYFACMDVVAKRNAYGRQLGSFSIEQEMKGIGTVPMVFIRAPYIKSAGKAVEILAAVDGKIVAAKERNMLVTAFHPELTADLSVHSYFLDMIRK